MHEHVADPRCLHNLPCKDVGVDVCCWGCLELLTCHLGLAAEILAVEGYHASTFRLKLFENESKSTPYELDVAQVVQVRYLLVQ